MGNRAVKPAVWMIGGKHASLCVVPPFLQKWEGTVYIGYDVFKTMWADREREIFSGGR